MYPSSPLFREAVCNLFPMPASKKTERAMKHLSDQELMEIVQGGDLSPASEIYDRYSTRIYNFVHRATGNRELAEDITQEVFLKVMSRAHQFHGGARLATWILAIAANSCRDYWRKREHKYKKEDDDVLETLPAPAGRSLEQVLDGRAVAKRVHEALGQLRDDHRQIILLARFDECTYVEIAEILGCSASAVKLRLFRAMQLLKKVLSQSQDDLPEKTNVQL
jgi:RNA polymerase sigma-70 factor (ECF subfamily)